MSKIAKLNLKSCVLLKLSSMMLLHWFVRLCLLFCDRVKEFEHKLKNSRDFISNLFLGTF